MPQADLEFNPARSIGEASARIFALSATPEHGTRGPRRSLLALATSLNVDVDSNAVNAILGKQVAEALGLGWSNSHDYLHYQVTLAGMNKLLDAAARNLFEVSTAQSVPDLQTLEQVLVTFPGFKPAQNKQEAVDRLSDLAGVGRDKLGPGGKEHLVTFEHLARRFARALLDVRHTKHSLAVALCGHFGVPWSPAAVSTMGTITKQGLNMILAGAERQAGILSGGWNTAADEAASLTNTLVRELERHWDGRTCVRWMRDNGSRQWRQVEWAGFYFEEKARELLNEAHPTPPIGGPRVRWGNTIFDYASPSRVWDAKAHSESKAFLPLGSSAPTPNSRDAWLNDAQAVRDCVDAQGLGFLVLDGLAGYDITGEFKGWHKSFGLSSNKPLSGYVSATGRSRPRKSEFWPTALRAIWFENSMSLSAAIAAGWIHQAPQPAWGAGALKRPRNDKFKASSRNAGHPWQVASFEWPAPALIQP